jgi:hypothetical protein
MIFAGGTLTIDDADAGGSERGAWATAIAHTPHLAAQVARNGEHGSIATRPVLAGGTEAGPKRPPSRQPNGSGCHG